MARRPLVVHVVGARPNYMKVAPVYDALEQLGNVDQRLIHTGQHYDAIMKDVFFAELPLPKPHVQLDTTTIEDTLRELERVFAELEPDLVVVAGDVNSTLAGAVTARKLQFPVCHIESGLRSTEPPTYRCGVRQPRRKSRRAACSSRRTSRRSSPAQHWWPTVAVWRST